MGKKSHRRRAQAAPASASATDAEPFIVRPGPRLAFACALAVTGLALALYLSTLAPGVTLVDSGELIVAAAGPGVAHPPGFPLYVLLAHLFTRLPLGSVAWRVNLASAAFAALAAGTLVWLAWEARMSRPRQPGAPPSDEERGLVPPGDRSPWIGAAPLLIGGALLATSRTLWSYATQAEVYSLNTWLLLIVAALVVRARRDTGQRTLAVAAAVFGLGLGVHHATLAATLPAIAALTWATRRDAFQPQRIGKLALIATTAAAAVYAYLPLAARAQPAVNWGDPSTLERFYWHVSGRQYSAFLDTSAESLARQAAAFGRVWLGEWGWAWPALTALTVAGLIRLWRRDRPVAAFVVLLAVCNAVPKWFYTGAEDQDAYYLPTIVATALAAAFGAEALLVRLLRRGWRVVAAGAAALALLPVAAAAGHFRDVDRSRFTVAQDYAADVLDGVGPGGLLLTSDWQVYSPLFYLQGFEGLRPEATVIDVSLLRRSWYFPMLRRRFPRLMEAVRGAAEPYEQDLAGWEHDPRLYDRDAALNRRITERFQALVLALVEEQLRIGPAYATTDVVVAEASPDPGVAGRLTSLYQLVPRALVFELTTRREYAPLAPLALRGEKLFGGRTRLDPGDVASLKVRPVYLSMVANRGRYLEAFGDVEGAAAAYRHALAWDPAYARAGEGMARVERSRRPRKEE